MKLLSVINQIKSNCPSFESRVAGAAEFDPKNARLKLPAAYAFIDSDEVEVNGSDNSINQNIRERFAVVVAAEVKKVQANQVIDVMHDLRAELWRALLNWAPGEEYQGCVYDGADLVGVNRDRIHMQFNFYVESTITADDGYQPDYDDFSGVNLRALVNADLDNDGNHKTTPHGADIDLQK